jgi:hypothetical protein
LSAQAETPCPASLSHRSNRVLEDFFEGTDHYNQKVEITTMSTIIENKKPVSANWQTSKVQAEVLKSIATLYASLETILPPANPELIAEVKKIVLINKGYYAGLPIKTPIELISAIAEYATNVLGIKVAIVDDINKASIVFEGGTLVNKLAGINNLAPGEVKPLVDYFKSGLVELGTQFGFKTDITAAEPDFIVTFIK